MARGTQRPTVEVPIPKPPPFPTGVRPRRLGLTLERAEDEFGAAGFASVPGRRGFFQLEGPDASATPSTVPKTIDTPASEFEANRRRMEAAGAGALETDTVTPAVEAIKAPEFLTELPDEQRSVLESQRQARLADLRNQWQTQIDEIQKKGKEQLGAATKFLSRIKALGRSVSGAPRETGLGVLGSVQQDIDEALSRAEAEFERKKALLDTDIRQQEQEKIDVLNSLKQQNFQNTLEILEEDRRNAQERRLNAQEQRLSNEQQAEIEQLNRENVFESLNFLIDTFDTDILEEVGDDRLKEIEQSLGLPPRSLISGFNLIKERQESGEIDASIEKSQFFTNPLTGDVTLGILYDDGSTETKVIGRGIGTRFAESALTGGGGGGGGGGGTASTTARAATSDSIDTIEISPGVTISDTALNVIDGVQSIDGLTPTAHQEVLDELRSVGAFSDEPPQWYTDMLQQERRQSLQPSFVKEMWIKEIREPLKRNLAGEDSATDNGDFLNELDRIIQGG